MWKGTTKLADLLAVVPPHKGGGIGSGQQPEREIGLLLKGIKMQWHSRQRRWQKKRNPLLSKKGKRENMKKKRKLNDNNNK